MHFACKNRHFSPKLQSCIYKKRVFGRRRQCRRVTNYFFPLRIVCFFLPTNLFFLPTNHTNLHEAYSMTKMATCSVARIFTNASERGPKSLQSLNSCDSWTKKISWANPTLSLASIHRCRKRSRRSTRAPLSRHKTAGFRRASAHRCCLRVSRLSCRSRYALPSDQRTL